MSARTVNFSFPDVTGDRSKKNAMVWKITTAILAVVVVAQFGYYNYIKKPVQASNYSTPDLSNDSKIAMITSQAVEFLRNVMTFSATQLEEHRKLVTGMMTDDYANAFRVVWQDPTLTAAIKSRAVKVSIVTNPPALKSFDKDGTTDRFFVSVSGNIIVESDVTYIKSNQHYFSGTVVLVKQGDKLKVQNVVWRNAE